MVLGGRAVMMAFAAPNGRLSVIVVIDPDSPLMEKKMFCFWVMNGRMAVRRQANHVS